MKTFFAYMLLVCLICISPFDAYAYTPTSELTSKLTQTAGALERLIEQKGEQFRETILAVLQDILTNKASGYASSPEKVRYVITFLIDELQKNKIDSIMQPKPRLTREDFDVTYAGFSIVQLPDQIVATVRNSGSLGQRNDDAFEYLAGFIFGDNSSSAEIAMTSPVTRSQLDASTYETAFIMPDGWTMESLPTPNTDRITLKELPGSLKAVRRFSGWVSEQAFETQRAAFQQDLTAQGIVRYGLPTLSQYDGPRVPGASRRNEIWADLNPDG